MYTNPTRTCERVGCAFRTRGIFRNLFLQVPQHHSIPKHRRLPRPVITHSPQPFVLANAFQPITGSVDESIRDENESIPDDPSPLPPRFKPLPSKTVKSPMPTTPKETASPISLLTDLSKEHSKCAKKALLPADGSVTLIDNRDIPTDVAGLIRRASCSRKNFGVKLCRALFTARERANCNVSGSLSKRQLDRNKVDAVRRAVFALWSLESAEEEPIEWRRVVIAIDEAKIVASIDVDFSNLGWKHFILLTCTV